MYGARRSQQFEALLYYRLTPLDKEEGAARPIGIGEVLRRIIGKCTTRVTNRERLAWWRQKVMGRSLRK